MCFSFNPRYRDVGLLQTVRSSDCDLPPALEEAWFCQLQIVSAIVRYLEFWGLFRGYINAKTLIGCYLAVDWLEETTTRRN